MSSMWLQLIGSGGDKNVHVTTDGEVAGTVPGSARPSPQRARPGWWHCARCHGSALRPRPSPLTRSRSPHSARPTAPGSERVGW